MSKIIFNGVDYAGGSGNYFNPIIYSDTERKVGVWRDNKPLYQKSFYTSSGISGHFSFAHGISNLDAIAKSECILRADDDSVQIPITTDQDNAEFEVTPTDVEIWLNNDFLNLLGNGGYAITLWYTKTTDVAGSGDYNTYGVPTVHYSTSEQVIGTWINGKPIYQRTWDFSGSPIMTPYAQWVDTGISASVNIDKIITAESRYGTAVNSGIEFGAGAGGFVVGAEKYDPINNTRGIDQLTLRYTKTTD